jgi:hypothetical protein
MRGPRGERHAAMKAKRCILALRCCQPPASIASCPRRRQLTVVRAGQKSNPDLKTDGNLANVGLLLSVPCRPTRNPAYIFASALRHARASMDFTPARLGGRTIVSRVCTGNMIRIITPHSSSIQTDTGLRPSAVVADESGYISAIRTWCLEPLQASSPKLGAS